MCTVASHIAAIYIGVLMLNRAENILNIIRININAFIHTVAVKNALLCSDVA